MSLSTTAVRSGVFIVLSSKEFVGLVSCRGNHCIRSYRVSNVLLSWYIRTIIISASWLSADRRQRAPVCCGCLLACGCRLRRSAQSSLVERDSLSVFCVADTRERADKTAPAVIFICGGVRRREAAECGVVNTRRSL